MASVRSIVGIGSLLSERSARSTCPNLTNFRVGEIVGFRRVFAHAPPIFFQRDIARLETKEMSSLSAEPCPSERFVVTVFEIPEEEWPALRQREVRRQCFVVCVDVQTPPLSFVYAPRVGLSSMFFLAGRV